MVQQLWSLTKGFNCGPLTNGFNLLVRIRNCSLYNTNRHEKWSSGYVRPLCSNFHKPVLGDRIDTCGFAFDRVCRFDVTSKELRRVGYMSMVPRPIWQDDVADSGVSRRHCVGHERQPRGQINPLQSGPGFIESYRAPCRFLPFYYVFVKLICRRIVHF